MIGIVSSVVLVFLLLLGIGWLFDAINGPTDSFEVQRISRDGSK